MKKKKKCFQLNRSHDNCVTLTQMTTGQRKLKWLN